MKTRLFMLTAAFATTTYINAQVITYDLTYTSAGSSTLAGQTAIDTSDPGASTFPMGPGLPSWVQSMQFTYTAGGTSSTYVRSDFTGIVWFPTGTIDWNADLVPQFSDINFFGSALNGIDPFVLQHTSSGDIFTLTSMTPVPEPWQYSLLASVSLVGLAAYRRFSAGNAARASE